MKNTIIKTLLVAVIMLAAASFATAGVDLSGNYWFGSLKADVTSNVPWGKRGTVTVTSDTWTQDWNDQAGHHTFTSDYTTSFKTDGSLNIILSSGTYNVAFNGDVMIHADTAADVDNRLGIDIITRKATNLQNSDVVGDYSFFGHYLGWAEREDGVSWGNAGFKSNNTGVSKIVDSDGKTKSGSFQWMLDDVNEIINISGETYPFFPCKGGLIARAPVMEPPYNEFAYEIAIKKTTQTITRADVAGTYQVRFLETGPGGVPYTCGQGTVIMKADGTYDVNALYSDGEPDTHTGTYTVGPGNKIKFDGEMEGIISPDKNLIFAPEIDRPKNPSADDWIGGLFFVKMTNSTTSNGAWTWFSDSNLFDQHGVYGTQDTPASDNMPGARYGSASWTDSNDNLWLFGGFGFIDAGMDIGCLNDLWKFDGTNWTWVGGTKTLNNIGVNGTKGEANPDNMPSGRLDCVTWTDTSGNFWLFGGYGYDKNGHQGYLNDLWMFDDEKWTWVNGPDINNQSGIYGNIGQADADNVPGARSGSAFWIDSENNLWLFGGMGYDSSGNLGRLNDLWKFDGTNWTWVSGSDTINQSGVYGTMGETETGNAPGGRNGSQLWIDGDDNIWLFGGYGYDESALTSLNDLWEFDGTDWTWVGGSKTGNQPGVYGEKGTAGSDNVPGGRLASVSWIDEDGNFWLFGGRGYDASGERGYLNDLWKFDGTNWTWIGGPDAVNQYGVYGEKGVEAAGNIPGARDYAAAWKDSNDNLWLLGGMVEPGPGFFNDLWRFRVTVWQFGDIPGQTKNVKLTVNDSDGAPVTFSLTGGGFGEVRGGPGFNKIILYGTSEKSQFTISTKGKTETNVGDITVNGPLKSISAKTTNVSGWIEIDGSLASLTLNDADCYHKQLRIGSSLTNPNASVTMSFDQIYGLQIHSDIPVKSLSATDWTGSNTDFSAPWVGNITVKGDKKRSIAGNVDAYIDITGTGAPKNVALKTATFAGRFTGSLSVYAGNCGTIQAGATAASVGISVHDGNLASLKITGNKNFSIDAVLSGAINCNSAKSISTTDIDDAALVFHQAPDPTGKILALGTLTAKGQINRCRISSTGNIGTVTAGKMVNSTCFAGVSSPIDVNAADGVYDLPDTSSSGFDERASIKNIKINGITGQDYGLINSNIAAARVLSVSIVNPKTNNSGIPFGITADYIKTLKVKSGADLISLKELNDAGDITDPPPGDVQIRLY